MQAVILAGGKGTRLASRLQGRPKPLIDVCGVPLLARQIEILKANGVDRFLVLVNHAAEQIADFCASQSNFGVGLTLIDDGEPLGTAGALLSCLDALDERFLVVYGDTLFDIDVGRMTAAHEAASADATLFLHPNDHPADSDLVELGDDGFIRAFHPYPHPPGAYLPNLVNAAFYLVEKAALAAWRDFAAPSDLAKHLFPAMVASGARLLGYSSFEYIKDLGTPARLDKVERHLTEGRIERARADHRQLCVFMDRDGTINASNGYVTTPEELNLYPGAAGAIRALNEAEYRTAIVTNQPVIARGDCSIEQLDMIHNKLESELGKTGAFVDGIWYCPHHPDRGFVGERPEYKTDCACRKPEPGLLMDAAQALNADLHRSWLIGDTTSDLLAARRSGVASILVLTGEAGRDGKYGVWPDYVSPDLQGAVDLILRDFNSRSEELRDEVEGVTAGQLVVVTGTSPDDSRMAAATVQRNLVRKGIEAQWVPSDGHFVDANGESSDLATALEPWLYGGDVVLQVEPSHRSGEPEPLSIRANSVLVISCSERRADAYATKRPVSHIASARCALREPDGL